MVLLTELEIKHAKAGMHSDGAGLYLQVTESGSKSWLYRFQLNGKRRWAGIGSLSNVSAKMARLKATELRALVSNGIDPIEQTKAIKKEAVEKAAKKAVLEIKFKQVALEYIEQNRAGWKNRKHVQQWENTLETYAYGVIGHLPPSEITTDHIFTILKDIWLTKTETATRLRGRLEVILSYAKIKGYRDGENPAAWKNHLSHILPQPGKVAPHKHHPALPYQRVAEFMAALGRVDTVSASCLQFTIQAACRSQESMECQWGEFDLDAKVWIVPPGRMKMKKEHRVPLTDSMLRILEIRLATKINEYVFPGMKENKPLSNMAMTNTIRRMHADLCKAEAETGKQPKGWVDKDDRIITVHGFRSCFRDWAAELTNYPGEMAELQLAHAVANPVEAAYRRGDMFEKRRAMMEDWAKWCGQKTTSNVIALGRVA